MATGANVFTAERYEYVQEIETLRTKAAKVNELEAENGRLAAELEAAREHRKQGLVSDTEHDANESGERDANLPTERDVSTVSIEEYRRVKDGLDSSECAYGKLVGAHNILQAERRYYKDMTKQWREYTKRWISKDATRRANPTNSTASKQTTPAPAPVRRSPNAPTPPVFPAGIAPSVSDVSRSTSPQQQASIGPKYPQKRKAAGSQQDRTMEALTDDIIVTQKALNYGQKADAGDSTESADDSDWIPRSAENFKTPRKEALDHDKPTSPYPATRDGGSSPVVVFERSLKRKRTMRGNEEGVHVHEDKAVKNEQPSSSPVPAIPSLPVSGVHDSLDLDDVGDHLDTPKKRQRMERLWIRPPLPAPLPAGKGDQGGMDDLLDNAEGQGHQNGRSDVKTEDGAQKLIKESGDYQFSGETEQERRAHKHAKRAQLQAHNNRVVGRLEATQEDLDSNPRPSATRSKSPPTRVYPTPATEGLNCFGTPKSHRENEQRRAELVSPVLRAADPNSHVLPRTSDDVAHQKRPVPPSRRNRGAAHVPALAEDGEAPVATSNHRGAAAAKSKSKYLGTDTASEITFKAPDVHHRLSNLLTEPSPAKFVSGSENLDLASLFPTSRTPYARAVQNDKSRFPTTPRSVPAGSVETRDRLECRSVQSDSRIVERMMNGRGNSAKAMTKKITPQPIFRKAPSLDNLSESRPEHEPLRARPLHRLRLEDFKSNPAHSAFAYHEPIRKYDEKRAVGGCTDRHCHRCKDQRNFVENSGYQTVRKQGESADEADQRILEDFLDGDKRRLQKMSPEEWTETLWQAKTKEYADLYGKHRQSYSRARSPPGMWDVDFPNTQKEEENREAARVMEREKVEERFFQALRRGGRYVFADEVN